MTPTPPFSGGSKIRAHAATEPLPGAKGRVRSTLYLLLSTLLLTTPTLAFDVHNVPTQGRVVHRAVISGNRIAWGELGSSDTTGYLYVRDLTTNTTRNIYTNASLPGRTILQSWAPWHPAIALDGDYLVWSDSYRTAVNDANAQIRSYNLATNQLLTIGSINKLYGNDASYPALSGNTAVWQAWNASGATWNMAILRADVTQPNSVVVDQSFTDGAWPIADISGNWIVWKSDTTRGIYAKQVGDPTVLTLHTGLPTESPRAPVIHGDIVAWSVRDESDPLNHTSSIQGYNLATSTPFTILADIGSPEHKSNVAISDRYVVWEDWRSNPPGNINRINLDVWAYDLVTGQSFMVAGGTGVQHEPWIDGNKVVWIDEASGSRQIMWTEIPEPATATLLLLATLTTFRRRHH